MPRTQQPTREPMREIRPRPLYPAQRRRFAWLLGSDPLPGYESGVWIGLFAPRGVASDIVATLNRSVQKIMMDVDFRETFLGPNFYEPILGTRDQFAEYVRAEATKWGKVVHDAKLSVN